MLAEMGQCRGQRAKERGHGIDRLEQDRPRGLAGVSEGHVEATNVVSEGGGQDNGALSSSL